MKKKYPVLVVLLFLSFYSLTLKAGGPWLPLNGPFGYNSPQTIVHHQGAIFVSSNTNGSTGSGVWRTTNSGVSWTDVSAGLPRPYARDMVSLGNNLFVASDTGVYRSANQGLSWTAADSTLPDLTSVYELVVHQGDLYAMVYYGTGNTELFKTSNNGQTWTSTGYSLTFSISLNQFYSDNNTLWASTTAGVYKSTDGGATFNPASNNIPFSASITAIVAKGDTAYCGTSNGTYFTTNGGQLWNQISIPSLGGNVFTYSWMILGNTVYAGLSTYGIYTSPLGQSNWTVFGNGYYIYSLPWMLTEDGTDIYAATTEGISSCPLIGGNWVSKNGNITRARTSMAWADNNLVLAGSGFYSGLKRTQNGGATWTNTSITNQQGLYKRAIKINNTLILPSIYSMFTSNDDGQTWLNTTVAPVPNYQVTRYGNSIIAPSGNQVVYSNDIGQTWNLYSSGLPVSGTVYAVGVMGQTAYAGVNNKIYKMEYPGAPWINFSQGISGNGLMSAILTIGNTLVINSTLGLYRRTIEDSLWRPVFINSPFTDIIYSNGYIFGSGYNGVYFSDNLGKTFHPWNDGFPAYMGGVENLFADDSILYAGTSEYSAWKRTISPEITITGSPSTVVCTGTSINVTANSTTPLNSTNKYYLQLSDRFGRFLNPIVLDSISSTAQSISMNGLLPDSLPGGSSYRVRIVSSSPYLLAADNGNDMTILQRAYIQLQPANQNTCQGATTGFYIGASGESLTYQWQVDINGSGNYSNLVNNAIYQQTDSALLLIIAPNPTLSGYRYRCLLNSSCGTLVSNYGTLTVNPVTGIITTQPASTTICNGQAASISLTATGPALTFQWQVNTGFGIFTNLSNGSQYTGVTSQNLTINTTSSNMNGYQYRCKIGNCLFSDTATLTINGEPVTLSTLLQEPYCDGGSAQFSVSVAGAGISYQWEVDDGTGFVPLINGPNVSGANDPVLQLLNIPASFNNYLFRCYITGFCSPGSSYSNNGELVLTASPTVISQPVAVSICEGDSAAFAATGTGSFLYYQWEMNNGTGWNPVPPLPPFSGINTGNLALSYTDASVQNNFFRCRMSGCITSDSAQLNLKPLPQVTASDLIVCTDNLPYALNSASPNGGTYYGTDIYNGLFQPSNSNTGSYVYDYFYVAPNGCAGSDQGFIQLKTCTDLAIVLSESTMFQLFPNPANEKSGISFTAPLQKDAQLLLYSLQGQLIQSFFISKEVTFTEIHTGQLKAGLYLVKIISGDQTANIKLMVLH